jgi:hypothetical protein
MKLKFTVSTIIAAVCFAAFSPANVFAQESNNEKEIKVGSHVLKQQGESPYSYNNELYTYEKIWEAPNASKEDIYKRVKKWLSNPTGANAFDIVPDEESKDFIGAGIEIPLSDNEAAGLKNQRVTCKFSFSFKDGKMRLQVSDFMYLADYDYGYSSSVAYTANGSTTHSQLDAGAYKMKLHSLKPLTKAAMNNIYKQFDESYLVVIRAMKKAVLTADSNW